MCTNTPHTHAQTHHTYTDTDTHTHTLIFSNNEVTSTSWLRPRHKESIVSITMRKNDGPLHMRWIWCPCPFNPTKPRHGLLSPAPCQTCSSRLPHQHRCLLTVSSDLKESETFLMHTDLCLYLLRGGEVVGGLYCLHPRCTFAALCS